MKNNRGNSLIWILIAIAVIIVAVFFGWPYLKNLLHFGGGDGDSSGGDGTQVTSEQTTTSSEESVPEEKTLEVEVTPTEVEATPVEEENNETHVVTITVSGDKVFADGEVISDKDSLRDYLTMHLSDDMEFVLVDQQAVEGTYTWVKDVFSELAITNLREELSDGAL